MPKLKFSKKKEKIPSRASKSQGLTKNNKVKLKGNKSSKLKSSSSSSKSKNGGFEFLKLGKSSYPEPKGSDDIFKRMAREEDSDSDSGSDSGSDMSSERPYSRNKSRSRPIPRKSFARPPPPDIDSSSDDDSDILSGSEDDFSSFSGSSRGSVSSMKRMSKEEEEEAEKQDLLMRLNSIKQRGTQRLSKNFTARSSLAELRLEMGRLEHEREINHSMGRYRRFFMAGVSGMEVATSHRKAPGIIKGKLNGFSGYVNDSIHEYDPIFERMSEKYGGMMGIGNSGSPIQDLLFILVSQVLLFVFVENRPSVKKPTEEDIKRDYPHLLHSISKDMAYQLREEERQREMQMQQQREQIRQNWLQQQQQQQQQNYFQQQQQQEQDMRREQVRQSWLQKENQAPQQQQQEQVQMQTLYHDPQSGQAPLHVMQEPSISLDFDVNTEEPLDLFKVDSIQSRDLRDVILNQPEEENLPVMPDASERVKIVEMPQPATNTRKGKEVKIQKPQPQSKSEKNKNEIVIA